MIRDARDPRASAALFDFGILANLPHALIMIPQAFIHPGEHTHLWADVSLLLGVSLAASVCHPGRAALARKTEVWA